MSITNSSRSSSSIASVSQSRGSIGSMSITSSRGSVGNGSLSGQVLGPGGGHAGLVHGDHGAVGVGHQPVERGRGGGRETSENNL